MFYVYTLTDPRDGRVFYVGKGKGGRLHQHERQALAGAPGRKCERIRDIASQGGRVEPAIVQRFAAESDAYDAEIALIASFDRSQLTNISAGGFGGRRGQWPFRWTPALIHKIAPSLRGALRRMNDGDGRLYIGDTDITKHVLDIVAMLRSEAGDDMLREHAGVNFA